MWCRFPSLLSRHLQAVGFQGQQTRETHKILWTRGAWDRLFSHRARWRCSSVAINSLHPAKVAGAVGSPEIMYMGSCKWCLQHTSSSGTATSALIDHHRYQRRSLSAQGPQSSVDQHQWSLHKGSQPTHEGLKPGQQRTQLAQGPTRPVEAQAAFPQYLERLTPLPK